MTSDRQTFSSINLVVDALFDCFLDFDITTIFKKLLCFFFSSDPSQYPATDLLGNPIDISPPIFTAETLDSKRIFKKDVGDTFKVQCEALGSPRPTIQWLKDGQEIRDNVFPRRSDITGRSTVELQILGSVDGGTYTCSAQNSIGIRELNYTLHVNVAAGSIQHAVVTEAGPENSTVYEGDTATLRCKVKSVALPHIKWLKKLEKEDAAGEVGSGKRAMDAMDYDQRVVNVYTLNMGNERYRVLDTDPDVKTKDGEFLNRFVIPRSAVEDSGMYICFVTNSGFGALTYKSAYLKVLPRSLHPDVQLTARSSIDDLVLALIITFVVVTFFIGVIVVICIIRRSRQSRTPKRTSSSATSSSDATTYNEDEVVQQRPFLMPTEMKFDAGTPSTLPPPPSSLFPTSSTSMNQWTRTVYPSYGHLHYGGSSHYENPAGGAKFIGRESPQTNNQYEVPYSHLIRQQQQTSSANSNHSSSFHQLLPPHQQRPAQRHFGGSQQFRCPPQGGLSAVPQGGTNPRLLETNKTQQQQQQPDPYPFRSYQYFQYLGDYEA